MSKQDMAEAIERTRAVLRAALILSEPEQETDPELIHSLMAVAESLLPKT